MADLNYADAITKLRGLPEDQQRKVLEQLTPEARRGILTELQAKSTPANVLKPSDRTVGNYGSEIARGVGRGLLNDVQGLVQPEVQAAKNIRHPIQSAKDFAAQGEQAADAVKKAYRESAAGTPGQRAAATGLAVLENLPVVGGLVQRSEQGGTELASPEGAGAAAEGITAVAAPEIVPRGVGAIVRKGGDAVRAATGTGTKPVAELVKKTAEENAKSAEKAAEKNADQAAKRQVDLKKHFQKTQDVQAENAAKEGQVSRREALNRGVEHLDSQFKSDLSKLRDQVHERADAKYQDLNAALDDKMAEPSFLADALLKASDKIKGSNTEPTILKDMEKKLSTGDEISYRDLQGYYSELGRELTKGTLQGDVYAAFDTLQDAVGEEMQRIADENGLGPQLKDARQTWRQMKETFYSPKSPVTKAIKSTERGSAVKAFQGKDQTGIEALAKYSPDLAQRANTIRGYHAEAAGLPKKATGLKSLPKLAEKGAEVKPDTRTISPEDIQNAKKESLQKRAGAIRKRGAQIVTTLGAYRALSDAFHGNFGSIPTLLGESGLGLATTYSLSKLLERPAIVDYLTKATPKDVESIPPELRGDLNGIVSAAQQKGIKVSPALLNAAKRTGVAAALTGRNPKFDVETGTSAVQPANELMPGNDDVSKLPPALQRELETTKIVQGRPTATYGKPDIATYEPGSSEIVVRDPSRFTGQVLAHELTHKLQATLPGPVRASFPKDDPRNPYMKPEDLYGLAGMRQRGMTAKDLPQEKQAQINQAWMLYQNDPEMRKILEPWVQEIDNFQQGIVMPTDPNQKGINTAIRPPAAPDYAFGRKRVGDFLRK